MPIPNQDCLSVVQFSANSASEAVIFGQKFRCPSPSQSQMFVCRPGPRFTEMMDPWHVRSI